jgi:hypothetical protein
MASRQHSASNGAQDPTCPTLDAAFFNTEDEYGTTLDLNPALGIV